MYTYNLYRGRHASKITEEEEDEEYLKDEEDALTGTGGTRLMVQPSCKLMSFKYFFPSFIHKIYVFLALSLILIKPKLLAGKMSNP